MHAVDVFCLLSTDACSVYRPVEIHISVTNQSLQKVLGENGIYIQLGYVRGHASVVPVHLVLISINMSRYEALGSHALYIYGTKIFLNVSGTRKHYHENEHSIVTSIVHHQPSNSRVNKNFHLIAFNSTQYENSNSLQAQKTQERRSLQQKSTTYLQHN